MVKRRGVSFSVRGCGKIPDFVVVEDDEVHPSSLECSKGSLPHDPTGRVSMLRCRNEPRGPLALYFLAFLGTGQHA